MDANANEAVQVATIQTLTKREYPQADIVIIDECHHARAATYKKLWEIYSNARFPGVTATPIRMNGDGFADLFDILVKSGEYKYFIENKYLVPVRQIAGMTPDLSHIGIKMNDCDLAELGIIMQEEKPMANPVDSYEERIPGKKMIVFAVNVEHGKKIAAQYNAADIRAEHLDAHTPKDERKQLPEQFRQGEIRILCNVDIISEGFDVPDCEAVQLARPTKSPALYLQQVGRCMRPAPNKECGFVLDNASLWMEHGLCQRDRIWTLKGKKKRKRQDAGLAVAAIDENGVLRRANIPQEVEGMELVDLTREMEDLFVFEGFLSLSISRATKPLSAYFKFKKHMEETNRKLNHIHLTYMENRISKMEDAPLKGFRYHARRDLLQG
jgi:superfamily II DNA or RNA helicase